VAIVAFAVAIVAFTASGGATVELTPTVARALVASNAHTKRMEKGEFMVE